MKLRELQAEFKDGFHREGFADPGFETRALLTEGLGFESAELITDSERELGQADVVKMNQWWRARLEGQPLAYLTGKKGFFKAEFAVGPGVLVPRPESELVVETALRRCDLPVFKLVDLGCGSGCIGLSLLKEIQGATLFAIDQSAEACAFTQRNTNDLDLGLRTQILHCRVSEWASPSLVELVVANPPYIAEGDSRVGKNVHRFEPHSALYSGADGLSAIREWTRWTVNNLRPGGWFVCEFGAGQSSKVREIMLNEGFQDVEISRDLAGHERVISGRKAREPHG